MLTKLAVTLGAALGLGASAGDAMAASLSLTVSPATVHPGKRYTVKITGAYDKRTRHHAPYLVAFIQYSGQSCRPTATAEYALPTSRWDWDVYPQAETSSPFKSVTYWKASNHLSARRVCAYLYANRVTPTTTAKPLVRTGAAFQVTRG